MPDIITLDTVRLDTVRLDTVMLDTVRLDTVRLDTVMLDTVMPDTPPAADVREPRDRPRGTVSGERPLDHEEAEQAQEGPAPFHFRSAIVSPQFRTALRDACPVLATQTPDARFCRNLLQYLLFPQTSADAAERSGLPGRIPVPCRTLAVLDGCPWTSTYRAGDRLRLFEDRMGIPLDVRTWDYQRHRARTVQPAWPPALVVAWEEELARFGQTRPRVYLDTGEPHQRSRRARAERQEYEERRRRPALLLPEDHPQRPVLEMLNRQSDRARGAIIRRNLPAACEYVRGMPTGTAAQRKSREWAMAVLDAVAGDGRMVYQTGQRTARVFAGGLTLHQLPRPVRQVLLTGCVTLDLKAAQLAELGLSAAQKPALKTATYALLFGMSLQGRGGRGEFSGVVHDLAQDLAQDLGGDERAWEAARRFALHPVTRALVTARARRMRRLREEGGLTTVFGKGVAVPSGPAVKPGTGRHHGEMRSALAEELQAYEQKLMGPALWVAATTRGVTVASYLHDGLSLHFEDKSRAGTVARMQERVRREAEGLGILTVLELE